MPRYKILIEYDGTPFSGWQYQADAISVQGEIERAIAALTGETVVIQGAGRTDAGVHALGKLRSRAAGRDRHHPRRPQRASAAASGRRAVGRGSARKL
jgi:tRNA pseudouridine(38-40) synthase